MEAGTTDVEKRAERTCGERGRAFGCIVDAAQVKVCFIDASALGATAPVLSQHATSMCHPWVTHALTGLGSCLSRHLAAAQVSRQPLSSTSRST